MSACSRFATTGTTSAIGDRWPTCFHDDHSGNAIQGDVVARDTTNSIIISDDGGLIATLGVDDLVDRPVGQGHPGRPPETSSTS